jgi:hypothetical protein
VTITGSGFESGISASLDWVGGLSIDADSVKVSSPGEIVAYFDLSGVASGYRDLSVSNPDGNSYVFVEGFRIGEADVEEFVRAYSSHLPEVGHEGQDLLIKVWLEGDRIRKIEDVDIYMRRTGDRVYSALSELSLEDDTVFAIVPMTGSTEGRGAEYYVNIIDAFGVSHSIPAERSQESPREIQLLVEDMDEPEDHPGREYRMFSLPLIPDGNITQVLEDCLGIPQAAPEWRVFTWATEYGAYVEYTSGSHHEFKTGRSYWLITRINHHLANVSGRTTVRKSITLSRADVDTVLNWNMICNPFSFPVCWDSVEVKTSTGTYTMGEAESIKVGPLIEYDGEQYCGYGYGDDNCDDRIDVLEPFKGYWVVNLTDEDIQLLVMPEDAVQTGLESAGGSEPLLRASEGAEDSWSLNLRASCSGAKDTGVLGVRMEANEEWDRFDRSEPPMCPGDAVCIHFPHGEWERRPGSYSVDFRAEKTTLDASLLATEAPDEVLEGYIWFFDVAKTFSNIRAGDPAEIGFSKPDRVPAEFAIYLIDRSLDKLINVRDTETYRFYLGERPVVRFKKDARFILLVGTEDFVEEQDLPQVPVRMSIYQNYPNPCIGSTIIRYQVSRDADISIRVYSVTGALVRELHSGHHTPGQYEIIWDGRNQSGVEVSSGVYFYRMEAPGFSQARRLVILR